MVRTVLSAVVALALAGCAALDTREVVPLDYSELSGEPGCYLYGPSYLLVADPDLGVALKASEQSVETFRIYWPNGYTAHRVGAEVEVSKPFGGVVAVTGRWYMIPARSTVEDSKPYGGCIFDIGQPSPPPGPST